MQNYAQLCTIMHNYAQFIGNNWITWENGEIMNKELQFLLYNALQRWGANYWEVFRLLIKNLTKILLIGLFFVSLCVF